MFFSNIDLSTVQLILPSLEYAGYFTMSKIDLLIPLDGAQWHGVKKMWNLGAHSREVLYFGGILKTGAFL